VTEEAFGRVIIEAQASGVPVVATKVGGVIDIIEDGINGLLVPSRDADSMAQAVMRILKDINLAKTLAKNALDKVKKEFSLELMSESTLAVYRELQDSLNILIIKISAIGDVVLSTPSIRAIREKFPQAKIFCLVGSQSRQILQRCPYLDSLLVYDFKNCKLQDMLKIGKELRKYSFDIVIDLQNSSKSHLVGFLSAAPHRYGYANKKLDFLLNHRIKEDPDAIAPIQHQFRTLEMLDIHPKDSRLELWISKEDKEYVDKLFESYWVAAKERLVGINLGASRKWNTKNWPLNKLSKLCNELAKRNIRVLITGSEDYSDLAEEFLGMISTKPLIAVGKTSLMQLASLIKRCKVFITPDSAPLHIAAAVGTPIVALFGPTSPVRHMSVVKHAVVIKKQINCSPCYKANCKSRDCMERITVNEVLEAVEKLIDIKKR
jgi:heptosyltransferase-2